VIAIVNGEPAGKSNTVLNLPVAEPAGCGFGARAATGHNRDTAHAEKLLPDIFLTNCRSTDSFTRTACADWLSIRRKLDTRGGVSTLG
jgi:hypothetical protein